jgi:hypothetical protein
MVKRVPGVSQICRHRPVGHWPNSRFDGKYSRISARRRILAVETTADINTLQANSRGTANGNVGAPNRELFPPNRELFASRRELPGITKSARFWRASRPRRHPVHIPSPSQACRQSGLLLNNGHSRSSPKPPCYTANWAILPSPCPASGTIVCLEAPLAGLVPAIHAFLCLADRGRQDVDARIKSDQARARRVLSCAARNEAPCRVVAMAEPDRCGSSTGTACSKQLHDASK